MVDSSVNVYVYDKSFNLIAIIEKYSSLIWSDRYMDCGDFELTLPYESKYNSIFKKDYLCKIEFSDHWCFIEKIEVNKEEEQSANLIVSGRSIESMLERRIVIGKKEFGTDDIKVNVQNSIRSILEENIINPSESKRKISNFVFSASNDSKVTNLTFADSYDGNDLLEIVSGICKDKHIGFKIIVDDSNKFVFSLYAGKDRSKTSSTGFVVFSPYYDNLITSNYFSSSEEYRNLMVVLLEDDMYLSVYNTSSEPSGLSRREIYESDSKMEDVELNESSESGTSSYSLSKVSSSKGQIKSKAIKKLNRDYKIRTGFEGDIVPEKMYKYREDYNTGDRVQFEDSYGNDETVYISEVVISVDENGLTIIPTFEEIDWE